MFTQSNLELTQSLLMKRRMFQFPLRGIVDLEKEGNPTFQRGVSIRLPTLTGDMRSKSSGPILVTQYKDSRGIVGQYLRWQLMLCIQQPELQPLTHHFREWVD